MTLIQSLSLRISHRIKQSDNVCLLLTLLTFFSQEKYRLNSLELYNFFTRKQPKKSNLAILINININITKPKITNLSQIEKKGMEV